MRKMFGPFDKNFLSLRLPNWCEWFSRLLAWGLPPARQFEGFVYADGQPEENQDVIRFHFLENSENVKWGPVVALIQKGTR